MEASPRRTTAALSDIARQQRVHLAGAASVHPRELMLLVDEGSLRRDGLTTPASAQFHRTPPVALELHESVVYHASRMAGVSAHRANCAGIG